MLSTFLYVCIFLSSPFRSKFLKYMCSIYLHICFFFSVVLVLFAVFIHLVALNLEEDSLEAGRVGRCREGAKCHPVT